LATPDAAIQEHALTLDPAVHRQMMNRAVVASAVGTTIEWYDFFLYQVAAGLVFPKLFFPASDPFIGTILAFSTNYFGFVSRPLGAVIFGHYGDRMGRKASLIATLMLMGVATVGVGLVPGYDRIGVWGAVFLTFLRVLQGIGVGGEWGGSVLLAGEWTDPKRRGFTTSFAQFGAPAGLMLANAIFALVTVTTDDARFLSWGWRIPFLISFVLVFVGLYIRVGIFETPVFARLKAQGKVERAPVVEVLRRHWREVILTALLRSSQQTAFYLFSAYIVVYGTQVLGFSRTLILNLVMMQATLSMFTNIYWGHLSDRVGRRQVTAIGCVVMMIYPFIYFGLLDTRSIPLMFLAIMVAMPLHDMQYGPQAAFIAESFPGTLRYSGASLGYQLASITAGGPAPIVALYLYQKYHTSMAVATYLALTGIVSLISVYLLPDRSGALDHQ
jgi:MFS family permease